MSLIAMTGNAALDAGAASPTCIWMSACPRKPARWAWRPTSSTTAALVMGDALAVALLEARGFTAEDFARSHPAGSLGRRLLLHISDVMHAGDDVPRVSATAPPSARPWWR